MPDTPDTRNVRRFLHLLEDLQQVQAFPSADLAAYVLSPEGLIQEWSPDAERLYGYSAGEALGHSVAMLGAQADEADGPVLRSARDGRRFQVRLRRVPLLDAVGNTCGRLALEMPLTPDADPSRGEGL